MVTVADGAEGIFTGLGSGGVLATTAETPEEVRIGEVGVVGVAKTVCGDASAWGVPADEKEVEMVGVEVEFLTGDVKTGWARAGEVGIGAEEGADVGIMGGTVELGAGVGTMEEMAELGVVDGGRVFAVDICGSIFMAAGIGAGTVVTG